MEQGRQLVEPLPPEEIGCLYLHPQTLKPTNPLPGSSEVGALIRHRGSVGGAWPALANY